MNQNIRKIFTQVPKTYERINHLLTFGLDIFWRRKAVRLAVQNGGSHWLDVCTGTGETAVYLSQVAPDETQVFGVDFTTAMLEEAVRKPEAGRIHFAQADVKALPFPDDSFDLITISFATRNLYQNRDMLIQTFAEFHRVLKPDAWFVNLETSQPRGSMVRYIFHLYIRLFVRKFGMYLSGSKMGYGYLASTIPRFYGAEALSELLSEAGFKSVRIYRMLFGIAAIHIGNK